MKGQVAFESLFLVLVIMTVTIFITMAYMQTHDTTMAYGIIRSDLLEQSNSKDFTVIINSVKYEKSDLDIFRVVMTPDYLTNSDFDLEEIQNKLVQRTNFSSPTIEINQ